MSPVSHTSLEVYIGLTNALISFLQEYAYKEKEQVLETLPKDLVALLKESKSSSD